MITEQQKYWILQHNGREITSKLIKLLKQEKIDLDTYKLCFEFWLSEHSLDK